MTALLGKTLLFAGCTAFGLLRGSRLRQRTACLGEFRRTLAGLARELAFSLRPVSDLMASAEAGTQGPTAAFFGPAAGGLPRAARRAGRRAGQRPWNRWRCLWRRRTFACSRRPGMCWAATMGRASGRPWKAFSGGWRDRRRRRRRGPAGSAGSIWRWALQRGCFA